MTVAARTRGLGCSAGRARMLGPVDLELERGELLLLVGPSGSGKTTLLRALAGLVAPSTGTIELFGAEASRPGRVVVPPERRGVAMLFQGGSLWPHMTVGRQIAFVLRRRGVARSEIGDRTAELLGDVELEGFEARAPATLSGGEARRAELARALASAPRLLLLDELLGPLDADLRASLLDRLAALHARDGWTTIHVSHDAAESRRGATRVARLERGRLVAGGEEAA